MLKWMSTEMKIGENWVPNGMLYLYFLSDKGRVKTNENGRQNF